VRSRPFERLCLDYLSVPTGKEGWKTILMVVDWFSRWLWVFKSKQAGNGVFMVKALKYIRLHYAKAESIFTDGWLHFNCVEVTEWCQLHGVDHEFSPEYAPWVNGLVEGHNNILLDQLKWACMGNGETPTEDEMKKWPDHFKGAVGVLNNYK
jgi:hypothetical protein